jgi:hypothetical protein
VKLLTKATAILSLATLWALTGCAPTPAPEPKPTLRAPECFDGTVEQGCPSWALDVPTDKTVSHITHTDGLVTMHYTDGTTSKGYSLK